MARFNKPASDETRTDNLAGGEAFIQSPKLEFVSILLTSFVKDQYYRSAGESLDRVRELMNALPDKMFAAKAAIYARTKFCMRSITHVVAAELANMVKGFPWMKKFLDKIIYRPDDMMEILSYYYNQFKKPETNAMRKGFASALQRFDEYAISKYKGEGKDVSLVDIVNLVHPKPTEALTKLIKGTLKPAETWETKLTKAGQDAETEEDKAELKGKAWKDLVLEKKIGYFALLRNLRNILQQAPEVVDAACEMLVDEKLIKKSLVLPFRFTTAMDELGAVSGSRKIVQAINNAVEISLNNVPKFEGRTLIALDHSGSMMGRPLQIGSLFAAVLAKTNDVDMMIFQEDAKYVGINPADSLATIANQLMNGESGGTNFHAIFERADKPYDRIIILSDMQGWMEGGLGQRGGQPGPTLAAYKKQFGVNPHVYSFDLQGYGTLQFPEPQVYCLAGFSDKVLDIMKVLEQDKDALIHEIEKVEL